MPEFEHMVSIFWTDNPNILLTDPFCLFPSQKLSLEGQLNAISRSIIIISFLGYLYSRKLQILVVAITLLFSIYIFYNHKRGDNLDPLLESFISPGTEICNRNNKRKVSFQPPSATNPLGNVMLNDLEESSVRVKLPAVSAANHDNSVRINMATQDAIQQLNPTHDGISNKLFASLGDQFSFEGSMRSFYAMPCTTIPNDRKGFADFCFGRENSGKDIKDANNFKSARELPMVTELRSA